jgi:ferredoxin-NADP reductase
MARATVQRRLSWILAQVVGLIDETPRVRSLVLDCPGWSGHIPGQHLDLRLTAPDGYQAQRSYSIATPADGERVTITVELVDDGEVSPFLIEEVRVGDRLELRGPIGGYFVWAPGQGGPLQLLAGGSGIVPLMAMVRTRVLFGPQEPVRLLVSARSLEDLIYREELEQLASDDNGIDVVITLTRSQPPDWSGHSRRVDREMLVEVSWTPAHQPSCYICGPTGFVEAVASTLVDLGHEPGNIRTERFGPTGG